MPKREDKDKIASELKKADLLAKIKRHYAESRDHLAKWTTESVELYEFKASRQWDDVTIADMVEDQRPMVTFNEFDTMIETVKGLESNNRQQIAYLPREEGDQGKNEVFTGAANWVRDQCCAEDEEEDMFEDMLICGIGWSQTFVDFVEDPDGKICKERRDPMRMFYDPNAKKKNLTDRTWNLYVADRPFQYVTETWPEEAEGLVKAKGPWDSDLDSREDEPLHEDAIDQYRQGGNDTRPQMSDIVRVVHYQWMETRPIIRLATPKGMKTFSKKQWNAQKEEIEMMHLKQGIPFEYVEQREPYVQQAFVIGDTILETSDSPIVKKFTYNPITGKRDKQKNTWYGMGRALKEPQLYENKLYSSIMEVLMRNAKGGMMAEEDAFVDYRKAEAEWASPKRFTEMASGAIAKNKVMPRPPVPYPEGLDRLMEKARSAFRDVTGLPPEAQGLTGRAQPGVTEYHRKQAVYATLGWAFKALSRYRRDQGRLLGEFILKYIADGRLIRIVGERREEYVPLVREELTFDYDIVVDECPNAPNIKEKTWDVLQEILPIAVQMGWPVPPDAVEYLPVPTSLGKKWKEMLLPPELTPEQQQAEQQKLAQQQKREELIDRVLAAEVAKAEADVVETQEKAGLAKEKAATEAAERAMAPANLQLQAGEQRIKQIDAEVKAMQAQEKLNQGQQEQSRKAVETQANILERATNSIPSQRR